MIIGVGRVNRWGPLQGILAWHGAVDGVGRVGPGVNIHGVGVALTTPSVSARRPWRVVGVCAGGGLISLVHQSVNRVDVLVAATALGRTPLTAGVAACLRAPRGPVATLTLDPTRCHGLLVGTVIQAQLRGLTAFTLRTAGRVARGDIKV